MRYYPNFLKFKHNREKYIFLTTLSIQNFVILGRDATSFGDDTVSYLRTPESSIKPLWKLEDVLEEESSPMPLYPQQIPCVLNLEIYIYVPETFKIINLLQGLAIFPFICF